MRFREACSAPSTWDSEVYAQRSVIRFAVPVRAFSRGCCDHIDRGIRWGNQGVVNPAVRSLCPIEGFHVDFGRSCLFLSGGVPVVREGPLRELMPLLVKVAAEDCSVMSRFA